MAALATHSPVRLAVAFLSSAVFEGTIGTTSLFPTSAFPLSPLREFSQFLRDGVFATGVRTPVEYACSQGVCAYVPARPGSVLLALSRPNRLCL